MASIVNYVADGATNQFQIPFTYINQADVVVTVNGTTPTFTFVNSTTINIASTPASGDKVIVKRITPVTALVDFTDGSTLFEADLDLAHLQNRLIAEESRERADNAIDTLNANILNINTVAGIEANVTTVAGNTTNVNSVATNMAEVLTADTNAATATTKAGEASASASTASAQAIIATTKANESSTSAAEALASKNAASTSENNASTSESNASASKVIATTKAGEALTSETNAASSANSAATSAALATTQANLATTNGATQVSLATTQAGIATTKANEAAASATSIGNAETSVVASAVAAANSAAAAATALDSFDDRYLGVKSSDPTVDNDGNVLAQGALYFSSSSSSMQVYDGANWIAASSSGTSSLTLFEYTATAGQTAFTGSDDNGLSMSFIAANLLVTMNGVILDSSDFTTSGGVTVTLGSGATVGDIVNIYAFKSFQVSDTVSASTGGTFAGAVSFNNGATVTGTVAATAYTGDGSALTGTGSPSIDDNGNATAITIDSSENIGIGTSSPSAPLTVNNNTDHSDVAIFHAGGGTPNRGLKISTFSNTNSNAGVELDAQSTTGAFKFSTGGTEAMRIDSSGNLLVGKTSTGLSVTGTQITSDGRLMVTRDGNQAADFNRKSSDGDIVKFQKDGTSVGSIGTIDDDLYMCSSATGHNGLRFHSTGIFPTDNTGANIDNDCNIGHSSFRFKDAYLSGGVYLGGTGSANKLDSYEEGTWTPVVSGSDNAGTMNYTSRLGRYTKVGRLVTLHFYVEADQGTGSGNLLLGGAPFTIVNYHFAFGSPQWNTGISYPSNGRDANWLRYNSTSFDIRCNMDNAAFTTVAYSSNVEYLRGCITYETDS